MHWYILSCKLFIEKKNSYRIFYFRNIVISLCSYNVNQYFLTGEGERCVPEGLIPGVIIPSECAEGLQCDRTVRKCVKKGY